MTREEAIANLKMISVAFVEPVTKEQGKLIDDTFDMAIKALEQEPCEDCCNGNQEEKAKLCQKSYLAGMEHSKQEPCEDAISRQAVLEIVERVLSKGDALFEIEDLPPVTPQPKIGHWKWVQYDYNPKLGNWHCSECRCIVIECVDKNEKGGIPLYKYCPQCGAKMAESEDEE